MRICFILPVLLVLASCTKASPQKQAEQAVVAFEKTAGFYRSGGPYRRVTVADEGAQWFVTRHVPDGWVGGEDFYWVDKRTMKVVKHLGEQ